MAKAIIKIDSAKFRKLIVEKSGTISAAATACGFSVNGFDHAMQRGSMAKSMSILVDRVLGIPAESYELKLQPEMPETEPVKSDRTLTDADIETIRQIVKEEVRAVWN